VPAAALLLVAYGACLGAGLMHFPAPACAVAVLLVLLRRDASAAFHAAAIVIGVVAAVVAWRSERDGCAARLRAASGEYRVRLLEPADRDGGIVEAALPGAACRGSVRARWPAGEDVAAGTELRVLARWIPQPGIAGRPDGLLVVRSYAAPAPRGPGAEPGRVERLRTGIARASRTLYGPRRGLVDALVVARRGGMDRASLDHFADAGLVHILSISGFHVGLIAAWLVLLLRACRVRRERAALLAALIATLYVGFLGFPPPAARAAALAWALAWSPARPRNPEADALLATTCVAVLLVDPWAILDLGAWLSALSLWGATRVARWGEHVAAGGVGRWLARSAGSSIGATLATAPLTALALGKVSLVGVVLNFAAIPVAAVAVPGVIASLLLLPLAPPLAGELAAGAGLALNALERLADLGALVPGGHAPFAPGPGAALLWCLPFAAGLWITGRRNSGREAVRRFGWTAVAAGWATLLVALAPAGRASDLPSGLTLHFLDVGQGDAAVLRTPAGHWVAVDAGPRGGPEHLPDAGRRVVVPFLLAHGARGLEALVVSHAHADHIGGAPAILERIPTRMALEPGERVDDPVYYDFLDAVETRGTAWHAGRPGERFELDSVRFTLLHPDPRWPHWGEDLNEDSIVLLVEYRGFRALFAGDAGFPAESLLGGRVGHVDLLKVGHHGSRGSSGDAWLAELRPEAAVVSVGRGNGYGHPTLEALRRLAAHGARIWRTDEEGTVTVTTDGRTMRVRGRGGEAEYDLAGERLPANH
jgi:competence protein ComEC